MSWAYVVHNNKPWFVMHEQTWGGLQACAWHLIKDMLLWQTKFVIMCKPQTILLSFCAKQDSEP